MSQSLSLLAKGAWLSGSHRKGTLPYHSTPALTVKQTLLCHLHLELSSAGALLSYLRLQEKVQISRIYGIAQSQARVVLPSYTYRKVSATENLVAILFPNLTDL